MQSKDNVDMGSSATILSFAYLFTLWSQTAIGVDIPDQKKTRLGLYLTAKSAYQMVTDDPEHLLFLDIRSREEISFLGLPTVVDANVPYKHMSRNYAWNADKQSYVMHKNPSFTRELIKRLSEKDLTKRSPIILICRAGRLSAEAANYLARQHYTKVYIVLDGYEGDVATIGPNKGKRLVSGWKNAGLPWTYQLDKKKMYRVSQSKIVH